MKIISETAQKINSMEIRGAAKIGRSAASALKEFVVSSQQSDVEKFREAVEDAGRILVMARPTAVSLPNSVNYVLKPMRASKSQDVEALKEKMTIAADEFITRSLEATRIIGEFGAKRIASGDTVMTHCNSSLAISVIKTAHNQGKKINVICTESRPRYQGRITARELAAEGIPVTMIVDSAVRTFMKDVDKVVVGADSIAANGALVNKIGTSQLAHAAHEARVIFMTAAETYKFHPETLVGGLVEIEERDPLEVANPEDFPGIKIRNPAFDVTPPEYIDLIITEKGVIPPPAAYSIIKEEFG